MGINLNITMIFNKFFPSFAEFILQKADDNYSEIERLEVERINDSSKNFENLEKEIALWAKVIERAPILKYDTTSEIYQRIQEVVQQYKMELTKQNKPVPEDFPLKSFEETAVQLISNWFRLIAETFISDAPSRLRLGMSDDNAPTFNDFDAFFSTADCGKRR